MKLLVFGDVVGQPGRSAVRRFLPELRERYRPDAVIANVENLAHGKGITAKTLRELLDAGVTYCTSGDHIDQKEGPQLLADPATPVLRPANFPAGEPGRGTALLDVAGKKLLLVNLIGTAFIPRADVFANPFVMVEELLEREGKDADAVVIDFHAETTSEKVAMGLMLDGRVAAVLGSHTHVATADARILPRGTAYRTDMGMTGLRDESLGVDREVAIQNFLHPDVRLPHRWLDDGPVQLHATFVEIADDGTAVRIEAVDREGDA